MGLCVYLTVVHIGLLRGELLGGSACGAAGSIFNCHAVTASPLSTLLGVPLALWGFVGYLATLTLACLAWGFPDWRAQAFEGLAALGLIFVAVDAGLLAAMVTQIGYLCPLCLLTYLVNLSLLLVSKWSLAKPWREVLRRVPQALGVWFPKPRAAVVWVLWGVLVTGAAGAFAVNTTAVYVSQGSQAMLRKQMTQFVTQQSRVVVDTQGDPLKGGPSRPIQVVEFSDFLCPSCQRASQFNPLIVAGHRQEVVFVFKNFPLDQTCNTTITRTVHPNACQLAAAAECAHEQGKFWALHDRIFELGSKYNVTNLEQDAARSGLNLEAFRNCLESGRGLEAVKRDIAEAGRLGVTSTPIYFVNGRRITGVMTPIMFDEFLHALRQSGQAP